MPALSNTFSINWKDAAGKVARCAFLVAAATVDPTALTAFRTAIAAVSAAYSYVGSLSFYASYSDTAAAGSFADNEDKALMKFSDADGNAHCFKIPAPLESIFDTDKETVLASAVTDYTTAMLALGVTKAGRPLTAFLGGKRMRLDRKGR
jgi:hypothetical protein